MIFCDLVNTFIDGLASAIESQHIQINTTYLLTTIVTTKQANYKYFFEQIQNLAWPYSFHKSF